MEKERRIELVLWGLFLVMLLIFVLIFVNLDSKKTSPVSPANNVINSYNTNNYYYYSYQEYNSLGYAELRYDSERIKRVQNLGREEDYYNSRYSSPPPGPFCFECLEVGVPDYSDPYAYESIGNHKKEYAFGSYADSFRVWVTNKGNSDYFRVEYTFYDCEGRSTSDQGRYYISHGEEKEFYVRDISHDRDAYCSWEYKVVREHD